jgi:hypothetical protein
MMVNDSKANTTDLRLYGTYFAYSMFAERVAQYDQMPKGVAATMELYCPLPG